MILIPEPSPTRDRNQKYLTPICFVLGVIFGMVARVRHPLLSSNTVERRLAPCGTLSPMDLPIAERICRAGMRSCIAVLSAINSASRVEVVISVCSLDAQSNGQPASNSTYPVCDLTRAGSWPSARVLHKPVKSASTYKSNVMSAVGRNIIPFVWVPIKYRTIHLIVLE
jgi:hypothetical protein